MAGLAKVTVRLLLGLACALSATSLIFAVWAVGQTGTRLPPLGLVLFVGALSLMWISVIANTVITNREIPKAQRGPLSINVAVYRRFARRSSAWVRVILAMFWILGATLGATGIFTSTPVRLFGGVMLAFYGLVVAMLVALLPEPHLGGNHTPTV